MTQTAVQTSPPRRRLGQKEEPKDLDLNDVLYSSNPGDRLDDLCREVAGAGFVARDRKLDPDHADALAMRLRSASLDMVVPSDAALLSRTATALEQVAARIKSVDLRMRAKARPAPRPRLDVAALIRRDDAEKLAAGPPFHRDEYEDLERRRVEVQNEMLADRNRRHEEQRRR